MGMKSERNNSPIKLPDQSYHSGYHQQCNGRYLLREQQQEDDVNQ
jgi:hypothetical protein